MPAKKSGIELFSNIGLSAIGLSFILFFYANNVFLTALLLLMLFFILKFWHRKYDIYFFVSGAVIGPIAEVIAVQYGVWQYANPSILGIPVWLPIAWGSAVVLIKRMAEIFIEIRSE